MRSCRCKTVQATVTTCEEGYLSVWARLGDRVSIPRQHPEPGCGESGTAWLVRRGRAGGRMAPNSAGSPTRRATHSCWIAISSSRSSWSLSLMRPARCLRSQAHACSSPAAKAIRRASSVAANCQSPTPAQSRVARPPGQYRQRRFRPELARKTSDEFVPSGGWRWHRLLCRREGGLWPGFSTGAGWRRGEADGGGK